MAHPQTQSHLLELPPELRNRIYEFTLCGPDCEDRVILTKSERLTSKKSSEALKEVVQQPSVLALLQTCHQIYTEAKAIFYQVNEICIEEGKLGRFVRDTPTTRLDCVQNITVMCNSLSDINLACKRLVKMKHLQEIKYEINAPFGFFYRVLTFKTWLSKEGRMPMKFMKQAIGQLPNLERVHLSMVTKENWIDFCPKLNEELQATIDHKRAKQASGRFRSTTIGG